MTDDWNHISSAADKRGAHRLGRATRGWRGAASAGPTNYIEALTDCGRLPLVGPETTPEAHDLVVRLLDIESTVERECLAGPSPAFVARYANFFGQLPQLSATERLQRLVMKVEEELKRFTAANRGGRDGPPFIPEALASHLKAARIVCQNIEHFLTSLESRAPTLSTADTHISFSGPRLQMPSPVGERDGGAAVPGPPPTRSASPALQKTEKPGVAGGRGLCRAAVDERPPAAGLEPLKPVWQRGGVPSAAARRPRASRARSEGLANDCWHPPPTRTPGVPMAGTRMRTASVRGGSGGGGAAMGATLAVEAASETAAGAADSPSPGRPMGSQTASERGRRVTSKRSRPCVHFDAGTRDTSAAAAAAAPTTPAVAGTATAIVTTPGEIVAPAVGRWWQRDGCARARRGTTPPAASDDCVSASGGDSGDASQRPTAADSEEGESVYGTYPQSRRATVAATDRDGAFVSRPH